MQSTIAPLLEGFSERQIAVKDELRTYAECDPSGFRAEAMPALLGTADPAARRYVAHLLLKGQLLIQYLVDPSHCNGEQAIAIAKVVHELGVPIDSALEDILGAAVRSSDAGGVILRVLDLFRALSLGKNVLRFQEELISHSDLQVRSRAALEIGLATKSPAWVARLLLNADPQVQANAVESLWDATDKSVKNVLLIAARSPHHQVAANGLVGLYRQGSMESVPQLLRMAEQGDPIRRESAIWAIGETRDARFLPWLTREFDKAESKEKQRLLRAMSRIRQQLRVASAAGDVRMTIVESRILPDSSRRIVTALWSRNGDLSALTAAQFGIWEADELVTDYSIRCVASPPLLILGLGIPRFESIDDPYAAAIERAWNECVELKRARDPWCLVRYLLDADSRSDRSQEPRMGRDEQSALANHMKKHRGFLLEPEFVRKAIIEPGQRELASRDVAAAVEKLVDITSRVSGPRHLFLFFDPKTADEARIRRLVQTLRTEPVTLHGFAARTEQDCSALRDLCIANGTGTFETPVIDELPHVITETYLGLIDRYEILYRVETARAEAVSELRISTQHGCGQITVPFAPADTKLSASNPSSAASPSA